MPISAPPPSWANIKNKPTTVSGFGITDMASQSVANATNATNASAVPWSGVSSKPNTVAGFGITDLQAAINALTGFANSVGSSGYQKLPSGLIVQWGKVVNAGAWSSKNVTLPISFPSSGLSILVGETNAGTAHPFAGAFVSTSVFNAFSGSGSAAWDIYWIAIGY